MLQHPAFRQSQYAEAILASKPTRYYRCGDMSGGVLRDLVGGLDLTITGTPVRRGWAPAPGIKDGASFRTSNGAGGYAQGDRTAPPATAYTLAAWTYIEANGNWGLFGFWDANVGTMFYQPGTTKYGFVHRNSFCEATLTPHLGRWRFLVGTWAGGAPSFYSDGVLVATAGSNALAPGVPTLGAWSINTRGNTPATLNNTGAIAECVLWPRALPIGEIKHLHTLGLGG